MEPTIPGSKDGQKPEGTRKPHWSLAVSFWAALIILFFSTVVVMVVLKKPLWVEMETAVGVMALAMFAFYTWILYHGVSFSGDETLKVEFSGLSGKVRFTDPTGVVDCALSGMDLADGNPLGCLVGMAFGIVLSLAGVLIGWILSNVFLAGIPILALPLFYIFKKSVFFVLAHSKECRGRIGPSVKYGAAYAFVKGASLYLIIWCAHLINVAARPYLAGG